MTDVAYPGGVCEEEIQRRKAIFFDLLKSWNASHNLVQKDTLKDFEGRHWRNSLSVLEAFRESGISLLSKIFDIGSGAGFPGLVLAIYGFDVMLTDIVPKKIYFLEEVIARCGLQDNCRVTKDVNKLVREGQCFDILTSRAFSSLKNILNIQWSVSRETTVGFYHKGEKYQDEIDEARAHFSFDCKVYTKPDDQGVVLKISHVRH